MILTTKKRKKRKRGIAKPFVHFVPFCGKKDPLDLDVSYSLNLSVICSLYADI